MQKFWRRNFSVRKHIKDGALLDLPEEIILLFFCGLTFVLFLVEIFFQPEIFQPANRNWGEFIGNVIFLNALHNLFTYRLILVNEDFRQSFKIATGNRPMWIWVCATVILYCFVFFNFYVRRNQVIFGMPWDPIIFGILAFHTVFLPAHHGTMQSRGICLLYDQAHGISQHPEYPNFFKREKFLFHAFLLVNFAWIVVAGVFKERLKHLYFPFLGASIITFTFLFGNSILASRRMGRTNKPFYMLRVANQILAPIMLQHLVLGAATHGVE